MSSGLDDGSSSDGLGLSGSTAGIYEGSRSTQFRNGKWRWPHTKRIYRDATGAADPLSPPGDSMSGDGGGWHQVAGATVVMVALAAATAVAAATITALVVN
uniref:Uncharacterized protein n=1 Tax=Oryza barthii TaxID=65489 RepID=A0A0D3G821_9ORYZ